jgi:hypothetical protein
MTMRGPRHKTAIALAAACCLVLPQLAMGTEDEDVTQTGPSVTLASGTQSDSTSWSLLGYESNDGFCLDVGYPGTTNAAGGCDWPLSSSQPASFGQDIDWDRAQSMVYGPALPIVDQVKLTLETGSVITLTPQTIPTSAAAALGADQDLKVFARSISGTARVRQIDAFAQGRLLYTASPPLDTPWPPVDGPLAASGYVPPDSKAVTHGTFDGTCSGVAAWSVSTKETFIAYDYTITGSGRCTGTLDGQPILNGKVSVNLSGTYTCNAGVDASGSGTFRFDEFSPETSDDTYVDVNLKALRNSAMVLTGTRGGEAEYDGTPLTDSSWQCDKYPTMTIFWSLRTLPFQALAG